METGENQRVATEVMRALADAIAVAELLSTAPGWHRRPEGPGAGGPASGFRKPGTRRLAELPAYHQHIDKIRTDADA